MRSALAGLLRHEVASLDALGCDRLDVVAPPLAVGLQPVASIAGRCTSTPTRIAGSRSAPRGEGRGTTTDGELLRFDFDAAVAELARDPETRGARSGPSA
jgi:hypothetical protein